MIILAFRCVQARTLIESVKLVPIGHCMCKLVKTGNFLLPEGGAMIILEYWCLDVFRP